MLSICLYLGKWFAWSDLPQLPSLQTQRRAHGEKGSKMWTLCFRGTQTWWDSLQKRTLSGCLTPWTTCLFGEKGGNMHFVKSKTFHNVKTKSTRKPRTNLPATPPSPPHTPLPLSLVTGLQGQKPEKWTEDYKRRTAMEVTVACVPLQRY